MKKLKDSDELQEIHMEYKILIKHCVRRTNAIEFVKCEEETCSLCSPHPVKAKKFMAFLRSLDEPRMFTPTQSDDHPGHYKT